MSKIYVYSTLSNDQEYTQYAKGSEVANNLTPPVESVIRIAGKANITNKNLITPLGAMTEVSDEELAILRQNYVFQQHEKNGFIKVESRKYSKEQVVDGSATADMNGRDSSAPLVDADVEEVTKGKVKPKSNKE